MLDFGSQYSHLICRRIRESNIYCELVPYNISIVKLMKLNPKGIIFSGGPASVYTKDSPKPDSKIFESGIPILGICYGHQVIIDHFDGKIKKVDKREYGSALLEISDKTNLFKDIESDTLKCWMSHSDAAEILPKGFKVIGKTNSSFSAAIGNNEKKVFGLQFHPEVVHTEMGDRVLDNFAKTISKANPEWSMTNFVETIVEEIIEKINAPRNTKH